MPVSTLLYNINKILEIQTNILYFSCKWNRYKFLYKLVFVKGTVSVITSEPPCEDDQ